MYITGNELEITIISQCLVSCLEFTLTTKMIKGMIYNKLINMVVSIVSHCFTQFTSKNREVLQSDKPPYPY